MSYKTQNQVQILLFTSRVRERLKDVLRQYELRERHFECVVRSKELEVLLSRARTEEAKQVLQSERTRSDKLEDEVGPFLYPFVIPYSRSLPSLVPYSPRPCAFVLPLFILHIPFFPTWRHSSLPIGRPAQERN